jgi:hypothetical protein
LIGLGGSIPRIHVRKEIYLKGSWVRSWWTGHVHIEAFYRHWLVLGLDCKYISGGLKIVKSTNRIVISMRRYDGGGNVKK